MPREYRYSPLVKPCEAGNCVPARDWIDTPLDQQFHRCNCVRKGRDARVPEPLLRVRSHPSFKALFECGDEGTSQTTKSSKSAFDGPVKVERSLERTTAWKQPQGVCVSIEQHKGFDIEDCLERCWVVSRLVTWSVGLSGVV